MSYGAPPPPPPGPPGPPGPYGAYGGYGGAAAPRTSGKAVAALITGIAGLVFSLCCFIFGVASVVALVLGVQARKEVERSNGQVTGGGLALAGIITGGIGVLLAVASLAIFGVRLAQIN